MNAQLIHDHSARVIDDQGVTYTAHIFGEERPDGTWIGWLEFRPVDDRGYALRTGRETSQPNREAVEYWALGLEPIYLDGALTRSVRVAEMR
jgi:hypothetical protein